MLDYQVGTSSNKSILSRIQIEKIIDKNPRKIILVPDNDYRGRIGLIKNVANFKKFSSRRKIYVYDDFDTKDFGETKQNSIDTNKIEEYDKEIARTKLLLAKLSYKEQI